MSSIQLQECPPLPKVTHKAFSSQILTTVTKYKEYEAQMLTVISSLLDIISRLNYTFQNEKNFNLLKDEDHPDQEKEGITIVSFRTNHQSSYMEDFLIANYVDELNKLLSYVSTFSQYYEELLQDYDVALRNHTGDYHKNSYYPFQSTINSFSNDNSSASLTENKRTGKIQPNDDNLLTQYNNLELFSDVHPLEEIMLVVYNIYSKNIYIKLELHHQIISLLQQYSFDVPCEESVLHKRLKIYQTYYKTKNIDIPFPKDQNSRDFELNPAIKNLVQENYMDFTYINAVLLEFLGPNNAKEHLLR